MIFGNLGNMGEMLKMAREMQGKLKAVKDELARETYEESAGGVTVRVNGDMEINDVIVDPAKKVDLPKAMKEAANKALKKAKDEAARKMRGLTGGLGLPPGLF